MNDRNQHKSKEVRVPLSIVFITIGVLILLTAGAVYAVVAAPAANLPALIPLARVPTVTPTPLAAPVENEAPVLLPETPLKPGLPSEARADEAPKALHDPVPGQPVRLVIPALNIDAPVWEVGMEPVAEESRTLYHWQVPNAYAAGWHRDSALLGEKGNTVLNGHHNIYGELFRDLVNLEVGAEIILYDTERSYHYRVAEQQLLAERGESLAVRMENARWIAPKGDERITLVTCWPYTDNSHRVIVVAVPDDNEETVAPN